MPSPGLDPTLSFTDHFAEYGFAVVPGLVDRAYCDQALARIRELIHNDLPLHQWTSENAPTLYKPYFQGGNATDPVLDRLLDQPRLRAAIAEMFGGPGHWDELRNYYIFLRAFDPAAKPELAPRGHIDFPGQFIPPLYRGFTFQVSFIQTEPFSGNITVHPGSHRTIQKFVLENPEAQLPSGTSELPLEPPYEFVAGPGDVLFMHHLMVHSGNNSHAANRSPRVAVHAEAFRENWLQELDPARPNLSPWERSLAHNGYARADPKVEQLNMQKRREYVATLRKDEEEAAAKAAQPGG